VSNKEFGNLVRRYRQIISIMNRQHSMDDEERCARQEAEIAEEARQLGINMSAVSQAARDATTH
jgi:post-segregation antitoxin (ccd killing protein)